MELSRINIGSYRTHEQAARKASYWKVADALFITVVLAVLALIPFVCGFVVGGTVADSNNQWADTVVAQ